MSERIYLDVPYSSREDAKSLGCRWDPVKRKWYCFSDSKNIETVKKKYCAATPILYIRGEDRPVGVPELTPEPAPSYCKSLRSLIVPADWDRLRNYVKERAGGMCEYCFATGKLYLHDHYNYDHNLQTRKLTRLLIVCEECREALCACRYPARKTGLSAAALGKLIRTRGWSVEESTRAYEQALTTIPDEKGKDWTDDFSILQGLVQFK